MRSRLVLFAIHGGYTATRARRVLHKSPAMDDGERVFWNYIARPRRREVRPRIFRVPCSASDIAATVSRWQIGPSHRAREMRFSSFVSIHRYEMPDLFSAHALPFSVFQRIDRPSSVAARSSIGKENQLRDLTALSDKKKNFYRDIINIGGNKINFQSIDLFY